MCTVIFNKMPEHVSQTMLSDMDVLPSIKIGNFTLELEVGELSPKMQEVARKELRETPELREESVAKLRELLKMETDLKCPLENDHWLIRFLRPCKFYPESARDLIKRYYAFKVTHADIYDGLVPSKETNIFKQNILTVLPNRDQHGRRVLIAHLGKKWKHKEVSLDEVFKGVVLYLEAAMLEPQTQVAGAVVVFDMAGFYMEQCWKFTPSFAKRIVDWLQDSIPCRVKNLHVVNQPYLFNVVFALFKPFLREKLSSRIVFHGTNRASLHKYMDKDCLPTKYGGTLDLPDVSGTQWLELLEMCDAEYRLINSYGYKK